jgi:hypothetical protein
MFNQYHWILKSPKLTEVQRRILGRMNEYDDKDAEYMKMTKGFFVKSRFFHVVCFSCMKHHRVLGSTRVWEFISEHLGHEVWAGPKASMPKHCLIPPESEKI